MLSCQISSNNDRTNAELRGVWLTNVDSEVLKSRNQIAQAMQFLADHHFNLVCPVVWNKGMTLYHSSIMDSLFGLPCDTLYGDRDPLSEIIVEAHKRDIAVIAWFEFGFSSSYKQNGGHILASREHWSARDKEGKLLTKNGFEWMNAYHHEVQNFMLNLICEVVSEYDVDGVQGDDRLPAQPAQGGYSQYTLQLYERDHEDLAPPSDPKEENWVRWRAKQLNHFAKQVYQKVKRIDERVLVSWAPSIYPWSYQEYLQDWPSWIAENYADLVIPQHYRYSLEEYQRLFDTQRAAALGLNSKNDQIIYPGILMNLGDYVIDKDYLLKAVEYNRAHGVNGEIFFFYEGLRKNDDELAKILLNTYYKDKVKLPFKVKF
jgi:uncharacterized lipoprotein YddW (UPF0748 family)